MSFANLFKEIEGASKLLPERLVPSGKAVNHDGQKTVSSANISSHQK